LNSKQPSNKQSSDQANWLLKFILDRVSQVDPAKAAARVDELRTQHPDDSPEQLADRLIKTKCQRTGAVGALTSGSALIPGLGTLAATTIGIAADLGTTITLQSELVYELAEVYRVPVDRLNTRQVVMLVTGLSLGAEKVLAVTGAKLGGELAERFSQRWLAKALPVVGVAASAGVNAITTYVVGQRAKAYFEQGPEAVGDWASSLRALTGLDERRVGRWLTEQGRAARSIVGAAVTLARDAAAGLVRRTRRRGR
jgi:hypothetical protein